MDIFSKREGPRLEDVKAKKLISENAATIRRLADQISNGGLTRMRQEQARRNEKPQPSGLLIYDMSAPARAAEPDLHVRATLNGRVVLVDRNSGRQIQLLGEIRRSATSRRFVLASAENGYLSPVSEEIRAAIGHFDGADLGAELSEDDVAHQFAVRLGLERERNTEHGASDGCADAGNGTPQDESSELL